ncbi:hypothetical protein Egran_04011 [Elaphomyces granulatus]|uniref:Uncharacterized protein n=1 Tax=Elaphomyces granulatus TaxID=519963 RepID=A0A232LVT2_9EURO|nr:hypothetical protein Egran_04011 [Elaphomyces granulatus]
MPLSLGLQGSLLTRSRLDQSTRFCVLISPSSQPPQPVQLRVAFQTIRKLPRTSLRPSSSNPSSFSSSPFVSYLRRGLPVEPWLIESHHEPGRKRLDEANPQTW